MSPCKSKAIKTFPQGAKDKQRGRRKERKKRTVSQSSFRESVMNSGNYYIWEIVIHSENAHGKKVHTMLAVGWFKSALLNSARNINNNIKIAIKASCHLHTQVTIIQIVHTPCQHTKERATMHIWYLSFQLLPVISNQTVVSGFSMAMTPTMWATGSLSMMEKTKGLSSKASGVADGSGLGIHSMWRRQVEDFWGRPLSTALIYECQGV